MYFKELQTIDVRYFMNISIASNRKFRRKFLGGCFDIGTGDLLNGVDNSSIFYTAQNLSRSLNRMFETVSRSSKKIICGSGFGD